PARRAAMSEIGRAQEEIAALRAGRMGQASIGTVVNPGTNLVPQAIAEVKREFPDILVRVEMDYSRPLVAKLLDGQLDIVIGHILGPEGVGELEFEPLADEPHSVIARAGHPLASRAGLQHADLVRHGWILPPADSILRARLDSMFMEHGVQTPTNAIETSSLPVTYTLLRGTDMLTALPVESVAPLIQAKLLTVLPIKLGVRMESFGIIRRRDYILPPGAERILQALRTTARRLYPGVRAPESSL
uniref:LysR substrate-binding domain-containing protein n=1 Tax=Xanthomonas axonopodis TaxID=53413 RepID=UPI00070AEF8A